MENKKRSPWFWIPSIYFAQGLPYVVVMTVSVIMYKRLGVSNSDIALYTSWLYLPWVIKPLWSPLVDIFRTKRFWIITLQLFIGAALGGVALTIPMPGYFKLTLGFFWLLAFSSATHDIATDGFYMLGLSEHDQAWFVGVRSTFYRFAMITGQGLLIILAGYIESTSGLPDLDIHIQVQPSQAQVQIINPDSISFSSSQGDIHFITWPQQITIPAHPIHAQTADSILQTVKAWNIEHHFVEAPKLQTKAEREAGLSWWSRYITDPLENVLRKWFGVKKEERTDNLAGNMGAVYFRLSKAPEPGKEYVMHFGRISGDKSISLVFGERMVFDGSNWNTPAMALIQIDPKLRKATSANFIAQSGNIPLAWSVTFFVLAVMFLVFFIYHKFILPYPASDKPAGKSDHFFKEFIETFTTFFRKDHIGLIITFLLLYRLAESQLVKLASPFLLDTRELGGLALTTGEVGFIYGTVGILFLTLGGLLGGFIAAKYGLKKWLWWMAVAINVPDAVYIYLSYVQPDSFWIINACVAAEQFGYGFGFTAYMLYMIYVSQGEYKTAHFAIATGFMALGMMIPGMVSGWLQEIIGYQHFFIWVMIATIPGFLILPFIPLDEKFGIKQDE